ncbi:MAG: 5-deoxy-glucuronate isomerase, partial [Candidatus Methanomethylophilaceae archaeon]|nr:5-deoxy-glucuronate isomerase [Candidatus Methanomethylophilaceae archaeon]
HLSYLRPGDIEDIVAHAVYTGTVVQAPVGYHPTVACPGTCNTYFWVMGALRHTSRSYSLAVPDPQREADREEGWRHVHHGLPAHRDEALRRS